VKQADGTYLESQSEHPDFNGQRLLNVDANTSNPREVAGWYSGLYDHKPTYVTSEANRMKTVADYMVSDLGKMAIQAKTQELIAANTGNAAYTPAQAAIDAEMAIRGEQQMLAISFAEVKGINTPQFQGHAFTIPTGGEPMTITYDEIDPISGDVKSVTKTFNPGDEVNIGDMQHKRVRADLYKKQSSMVDHIQTGGKATDNTTKKLTPAQIAQNKSDTAFYTDVSDAAQWDTDGYIAASNGKFTRISRAHNGKTGADFRWTMKIYDKNGNVERIDYPVKKDANKEVIKDANGEPVLDVAKMEERLADYLEGGKAKAGTGRFRKGKGNYGKTPYKAKGGTPEESMRYYPVSKGAQRQTDKNGEGMFIGKKTYPRFTRPVKNKQGKLVAESVDSNTAMTIIEKGYGLVATDTLKAQKKKDIKQYLRGFGSVPDTKVKVETFVPNSGQDTNRVTIASHYKGMGQISLDIVSNKPDAAQQKSNKKLMELGMKYYHARTDKQRAAIRKEINKAAPCINKKKVTSRGIEIAC